ncbi:MAG TPA: FAD binding domain-containing protein, partial [Steroidobacteraceae bacterium]|nr:FAD binding domain-containing protein [Steroidobacteraceae bacterium]
MSALLPGFRMLRPAAVDEAVAACQGRDDARYLAGGTDLIVNLRHGLGAPALLIDLTGIGELSDLRCGDRGARIGAGVRIARLAADPAVGSR